MVGLVRAFFRFCLLTYYKHLFNVLGAMLCNSLRSFINSGILYLYLYTYVCFFFFFFAAFDEWKMKWFFYWLISIFHCKACRRAYRFFVIEKFYRISDIDTFNTITYYEIWCLNIFAIFTEHRLLCAVCFVSTAPNWSSKNPCLGN